MPNMKTLMLGSIKNIPLDSTEFRVSLEDNTKYCIIINETSILSSFHSQSPLNSLKATRSAQSNSLSFTLNYSNVGPFNDNLNSAEMFRYIKDWMSVEASGLKSDMQNLNSTALPMILYPNVFDSNGIYLSSTFDIYFISMQMSIQKWKPKPEWPCAAEHRWISANISCIEKCVITALWNTGYRNTFGFEESVLFGKTKPSDISVKKDIVFLSNESKTEVIVNEEFSTNYTETLNQALANCQANQCDRNKAGCDVYNFQYTVTGKVLYDCFDTVKNPNTKIMVVVQYPLETNVLVMTETDAQTWEGFVGNVGGVLGIWTGASVLSFLQLIYLCCFTESTFGGSASFDVFKIRPIVEKKIIVVKHK